MGFIIFTLVNAEQYTYKVVKYSKKQLWRFHQSSILLNKKYILKKQMLSLQH